MSRRRCTYKDSIWVQELWITFYYIFIFYFLIHIFCKKWWIIFVFEKFFSPQKLIATTERLKISASFGFAIDSQDNLGQVLSLTWGFVWIQNEETKLWHFCVIKNQTKVRSAHFNGTSFHHPFICLHKVHLSLLYSFVLSSYFMYIKFTF